MSFAENTSVSVEKSRAEIEKILTRYGADQFVSGWNADDAMIGFRAKERLVRFQLKLPRRDEKRFTQDRRWRTYPKDEQLRRWEQACRQRWRALALVIKAKLEAVDAGIATFEEEFLAHVMLPGGETVGSYMTPQIKRAYETGEMPALLPMLPARREP